MRVDRTSTDWYFDDSRGVGGLARPDGLDTLDGIIGLDVPDALDDLGGLDDPDDPDDAGDDGPVAEVDPPDLDVLAGCGPRERARVIDRYVRGELARVLRVPPDSIDTTGRPMNSLGVGSVNGLELQRRMESALRVSVNLQRLLRANSAAELVDCLAGQLGPEDDPHRSHASGPVGTGPTGPA
ncbi:hypothetical protein F0L17_18050 [Streptomyces sp. TRM43335]|uniref:Polyketide synthase-like phosphopantetheine-binding domain-containing protein n=1 Tax=Streptomyces taklimakanensis TaxID=2569853 RepID=A0A6G2BFT8_9ACTN|nr:acyl carrier protein [Streptomyces taklimakanensis]MTE20986.1 hypothetical protein [Streptomyces taklimakanensis]